MVSFDEPLYQQMLLVHQAFVVSNDLSDVGREVKVVRYPPEVDRALTSAPCSRKSLMMSSNPAQAASIRGEQSPFLPRSSTSVFMASRI